jgi:hypothetical protein
LKYEICPVCNKIYNLYGFHKHLKTHGQNAYVVWKAQKIKPDNRDDKYVETNGIWKCQKCEYESTNLLSVSNHFWQKHTFSINRKSTGFNFGRRGEIPWNKGLTKETDERVAKNAKSLSNTIQKQIRDGVYVARKMGEDSKKILSEIQSLKNRGGKSKWYEINGTKVQGSWEYNIALILNALKIQWYKPTVNNDIWKYIIDGKERSYSPDFYLIDYNCWLEIKGYWWGNDKQKMEIVQKSYPDRKIIIIDGDIYKKLMSGEQVWLLRMIEDH